MKSKINQKTIFSKFFQAVYNLNSLQPLVSPNIWDFTLSPNFISLGSGETQLVSVAEAKQMNKLTNIA